MLSTLDIPAHIPVTTVADRLGLIANALWADAAHGILILCTTEQARLLDFARIIQIASDEVRVMAGDLAAERRETARLRAQLRERPTSWWRRS